MRHSKEFISARSDITALEVLQGSSLALATLHHGIRIYDIDSRKVLVQVAHPYLNAQTTHISFSPDGTLAAFYTHPFIHVMQLQNRQLIKSIKIPNDEVSTLTFDLSSTYILAGTKNGRVFQYRYNANALLYRLCSFTKHPKLPNSVTAITLFGNTMACSSASGELCLLNLYAKTNKTFYKLPHGVATCLLFLHDGTLLCVNTQGTLSFYQNSYFEQPQSLETSLRDIKEVFEIKSTPYLLLLRKDGSIVLFSKQAKKIIPQGFLQKNHKILTAIIIETKLFLGFANNSVEMIELYDTKELESHILHNALDNAYKIAQLNPLLQTTKPYLELEQKYQKLYQHAISGLKNQNKDSLKTLLNHFAKVQIKKEELALLEQTFLYYPSFQTLFLEKKYHLAYAMSSRFPALQKTYPYQKMEEVFKDAFKNAQRHLLLGRKEDAKTLLQPYMIVESKRAFIKLMLTQNKLFITYLKAVEKRDFALAYKIVQAQPIFTQMPNYTTLLDKMQENFAQAFKLFTKGRTEEAKEYFIKLVGVALYTEQIEHFLMACEAMQKLQNAYEKGDFVTCYVLLDAYKDLASSDLAKLLERHWLKLIEDCEEYALKANIQAIKETLQEFLHIPSRKEKIGDLLRVSFHSKIKMFLHAKRYKSAENIIYSYIDIFGEDTEMKELKELYETLSKQKLAITMGSKRKESWINEPFV